MTDAAEAGVVDRADVAVAARLAVLEDRGAVAVEKVDERLPERARVGREQRRTGSEGMDRRLIQIGQRVRDPLLADGDDLYQIPLLVHDFGLLSSRGVGTSVGADGEGLGCQRAVRLEAAEADDRAGEQRDGRDRSYGPGRPLPVRAVAHRHSPRRNLRLRASKTASRTALPGSSREALPASSPRLRESRFTPSTKEARPFCYIECEGLSCGRA